MPKTIRDFRERRIVITYRTALKLADALGLELEPAKVLARSDAPPPSPLGPISAPVASPAKPLTESQSRVIDALKAAGQDGLIGAALQATSGVRRYWHALKDLETHPEHGPKIHFPGSGGKMYKYY